MPISFTSSSATKSVSRSFRSARASGRRFVHTALALAVANALLGAGLSSLGTEVSFVGTAQAADWSLIGGNGGGGGEQPEAPGNSMEGRAGAGGGSGSNATLNGTTLSGSSPGGGGGGGSGHWHTSKARCVDDDGGNASAGRGGAGGGGGGGGGVCNNMAGVLDSASNAGHAGDGSAASVALPSATYGAITVSGGNGGNAAGKDGWFANGGGGGGGGVTATASGNITASSITVTGGILGRGSPYDDDNGNSTDGASGDNKGGYGKAGATGKVNSYTFGGNGGGGGAWFNASGRTVIVSGAVTVNTQNGGAGFDAGTLEAGSISVNTGSRFVVGTLNIANHATTMSFTGSGFSIGNVALTGNGTLTSSGNVSITQFLLAGGTLSDSNWDHLVGETGGWHASNAAIAVNTDSNLALNRAHTQARD
jgi:hypothetical protein